MGTDEATQKATELDEAKKIFTAVGTNYNILFCY